MVDTKLLVRSPMLEAKESECQDWALIIEVVLDLRVPETIDATPEGALWRLCVHE